MVVKNENMDYLIGKYGSPDVRSEPSVSVVKNEYPFDVYGLPVHHVKSLIRRQELFNAAKMLLASSCGVLILSRNSDGSPSILECGDSCNLLHDYLNVNYDEDDDLED